MRDHIDVCDRCGETTTDIDAGFCPALQNMGHGQTMSGVPCGGTWCKREATDRAEGDE